MRIGVIPRGIDALPTLSVVALVKIEHRELDVGHVDGCLRRFAHIRPDVQLEPECDRIDFSVVWLRYPVNIEITESLFFIEPVEVHRKREVRGCVADDEVHKATQPKGGSFAHDVAENHFVVVRMSGVEVSEPAPLALTGVARGQ